MRCRQLEDKTYYDMIIQSKRRNNSRMTDIIDEVVLCSVEEATIPIHLYNIYVCSCACTYLPPARIGDGLEQMAETKLE